MDFSELKHKLDIRKQKPFKSMAESESDHEWVEESK
jgi:hypothetical protein